MQALRAVIGRHSDIILIGMTISELLRKYSPSLSAEINTPADVRILNIMQTIRLYVNITDGQPFFFPSSSDANLLMHINIFPLAITDTNDENEYIKEHIPTADEPSS
jgi:hypothetical protein